MSGISYWNPVRSQNGPTNWAQPFISTNRWRFAKRAPSLVKARRNGWYLAGKDLAKELPPHTFRRHRASIKAAKGSDIAIRLKSRAVRPEALGRQQCYDRRWEPAGDLRKTVLCEESKAIVEELQWGLAFLETGKVPDIDGAESRSKWLRRWAAFAERESGPRDVPEAIETPTRPPTPAVLPRKRGSGIGDAPVVKDQVDQVIYIDGVEWVV